MAILEEVIKLKDLKVNTFNTQSNEDFTKFYINDDMDDVERLNYIMKKGYNVQKLAVRIL
jgi:hypothetical protein